MFDGYSTIRKRVVNVGHPSSGKFSILSGGRVHSPWEDGIKPVAIMKMVRRAALKMLEKYFSGNLLEPCALLSARINGLVVSLKELL